MLQISTGKFYESTEPEHIFDTTHRGIIYSNYSFLPERIQTQVGALLPATRFGDLRAVICEITERLPKPGGKIQAGMIVSVGPDTLIQDFAAIVSFGLNVTCTADGDLARRLVVARNPPLGIAALPKAYVPRMFDDNLPYVQKEVDDLVKFIQDLMGLQRANYKGAVRAIERYVTAMHRLGDDLSLAYTLLVASIESLVQGFDDFEPSWKDLDPSKRGPIDKALAGAPENIATDMRAVILKIEHVALSRRFVEFAHEHVQPSFFRSEAKGRIMPVGRTALVRGLKNAYLLRSKYVHELQPLPPNLVRSAWQGDLQLDGNVHYLSFSGLARVARHIILEFVRRAPKVERETYEYFNDYPNMLRMQLDPIAWLHNSNGFSHNNAQLYLNGFLKQLIAHLVEPATSKLSDLREVCKQIETQMPGLVRPEQKLPMLLLYLLFTQFLPNKGGKEVQDFLAPNLVLFDTPSIVSLLAHVITGQEIPDWTIEVSDQLLRDYNEQRLHKSALDAGSIFGAAMFLCLAEMHRASGNELKARQLISQAVDEYPDLEHLRNLEFHLPHETLPEFDWWDILVQPLQAASAPAELPVKTSLSKRLRTTSFKSDSKNRRRLRDGARVPRR